jgi:AcrR family transcriptional regulator
MLAPVMTTARKKKSVADPEARRKAPVRDKGRRTRERIVSSAAKVFADRGYLDTRVADIAKKAGIAHGSFYTYFDSKEDVFRDVAGAVVDEMYAALETHGEGSTYERIHAANRRYLDLYERHAGILALIEQVATFDEHFRTMRLGLRQRFIERIERAVVRLYAENGSDFPPLDPRTVANALGGMVDNFSYTWFVLKEPFERETALATLDEVWARTLGLPEGMGSGGATAVGGSATSR